MLPRPRSPAGPDGHLFDYSNEYFGTTNSDLFNRLPQDIQTTLYSMKASTTAKATAGWCWAPWTGKPHGPRFSH